MERENGDKNNLILFPGYEALKQETEMLRTELSMLVLERDELLYVECKNLEMLYMLEFGALEYKAYEAQCAALRAKRKLEMIRAKQNRQEPVSVSEIEILLDEEFADYQKKLEEQIDKMNEALERRQEKLLSEEETKELKKRYRHIIKALHPDLHPEFSEAQKKLFYNAVKAYENGDLNSMRIIDEMISASSAEGERENTAIDSLVQEKKRLSSLLKGVKEEIQKIRSDYPYSMKELLCDPKKIDRKKQELQDILRQYQEQKDFYFAKIQELLR